jgi:hypothetical protein
MVPAGPTTLFGLCCYANMHRDVGIHMLMVTYHHCLLPIEYPQLEQGLGNSDQ